MYYIIYVLLHFANIIAIPEPDVYWKKGNKKMKSKKKKIKLEHNKLDSEYILEIYNANSEDYGEYTVKAVNTLGEAKAKVVVSEILKKSSSDQDMKQAVDNVVGNEETTGPLIELAPQPVSVKPGETIRLTCKAKGKSLEYLNIFIIYLCRIHLLCATFDIYILYFKIQYRQ